MKDIIQIKSDNVFHNLINKENIDIIEWITMQILNISYLEVHGNCYVENIRLKRIHKKD